MAAKKINSVTLLTDDQKCDILAAKHQSDIIRICANIPTDDATKMEHKKFFCQHAYESGVKYFKLLPSDYQEAILDRVIRKYTLMELFCRYNEDFFMKCVVRIFSKERFDRRKFINGMFTFLSDESTVAILQKAETLTTDSRALKRMKKVIGSYVIQFNPEEEE